VVPVIIVMGFLDLWARPHRLARELESLPVGLEVWHKPERVVGRRSGGSGGWPYVWFFQTGVRVRGDRPLRIEKFGMAAWHRGKWVYSTSRQVAHLGPLWPPNCTVFRRGEFEREYGCPSGWLVPGKEFWDRHNWAGSGRPETFQQNWFFIARDSDGHRYKGEGVVELIVSLQGQR
jgi:hypothetical protein